MNPREALIGGALVLAAALGLGACGGPSARIEYRVLPVDGRSPDAGATDVIAGIFEERLASAGIQDATVRADGADRIVVELRGAGDPDPIRGLLARPGRLDFVPLPPERYGTSTEPGPNAAVTGEPLPTTEAALLSGGEIGRAFPATDASGNLAVGFRLTSEGAERFGDFTTANVGTFIAIVLDGLVMSAPVIESPITGGEGIITGGTGGFEESEMNDLVAILASDPLPFPVEEVAVDADRGSADATATP